MFHNISNPKWFGNWSRLEDDYLGNGGTDIADNFTFSKMEKTDGLFGSIIYPGFRLRGIAPVSILTGFCNARSALDR